MIARLLLAICVCLAATSPASAAAPVAPLAHGHAHNDYNHTRPLCDALDQGFCSVEADICLIDGELRVGHKPEQTTPLRTLKSLYLDPLQQRVAANGGHVYPTAAPFTLMIDFKTPGDETYPVLRDELAAYAPMLTRFHAGKIEPGAVTIIVTGDYPRATIAAEKTRSVACDGSLEDLDAPTPPPTDLVPQIQASWKKNFQWHGYGQMSPDDLKKLQEIMAKAHAQHRLVRFWEAPDRANAWRQFRNAGIDLINTDDLAGCAAYLHGEH
ncbi:MAG TPA: phosphatidylinositol-specific phospholipase C/glycerophosphodiester phosphodiesterase family protein [Tepidisphaeraceae bacterium]|nr:phosphatidylinositol-specific phospholipase C/glycerophosphodiester phosphodiesterase family protein [Tepidisphaeraceae bacterium]